MELGYYSHASNTLLSVNGMILTEHSGDVTEAGQQLVYKIEEADILSSQTGSLECKDTTSRSLQGY